jgi:hypothetical protein
MSNNSFLPEGYKTEVSGGNYTRLNEGETRIRILSKPLIFWEAWQDKTPIRFPYTFDGKKPKTDLAVKQCWALKIYNHTSGKIEILQLHQASIKVAIENLSRDEDYGNPFGYDIKIIRKGKTLNDTEYSVIPTPPKPVSEDIKLSFANNPIDLDNLLTNDNPFTNPLQESASAEKKSEPVKEAVKETLNAEEVSNEDLPF